MNMMDPQLLRLRERVSVLEEENAALKSLLGVSYSKWMRYRVLGLAPHQCRLLSLLMEREIAMVEAEWLALYPDPDVRDRRVDNNIKVAVHHIRKVLAPHGIEIDTLWRLGHRITPEHKRKIEALLAARPAT